MTEAAHDPTNALLVALPGTQHLLADASTRIVRRALDANWIYEIRDSRTTVGWNPFRAEIYVAANSLVAQWLDNPTSDLRVLNENDLFLSEFAFVLHDHLHIWATQTIAELRPELCFGQGTIAPARLEEHAFAMVVSEAVATVGLDYWDLCCRSLAHDLDIGTSFNRLTVSYQTALEHEYRRFQPDFDAQTPAFFGVIARFYATGVFPGFDGEALRRSPVTLRWLEHELTYGATQRRYSRSWLRHLAGVVDGDVGLLDAAIEIPPWGDALIGALGERLWAKVKRGEACPPRVEWSAERAWRAPEQGPIDFRFTNLAALPDLDDALSRRGMVEASRPQWREQLLRTRRFPLGERHAASAMRTLTHATDASLIAWAVTRLQPLALALDEPLDMFFLK